MNKTIEKRRNKEKEILLEQLKKTPIDSFIFLAHLRKGIQKVAIVDEPTVIKEEIN